jgi:hypothetical protein
MRLVFLCVWNTWALWTSKWCSMNRTWAKTWDLLAVLNRCNVMFQYLISLLMRLNHHANVCILLKPVVRTWIWKNCCWFFLGFTSKTNQLVIKTDSYIFANLAHELLFMCKKSMHIVNCLSMKRKLCAIDKFRGLCGSRTWKKSSLQIEIFEYKLYYNRMPFYHAYRTVHVFYPTIRYCIVYL